MNIFKLKRTLNLTLKNQFGWKTSRKIVVFSVDDYGNVRMASREAKEKMKKNGLNVESNRFDRLDALEDEEDLIQLYDSLTCVSDKNGKHPVFTTFSLPVNPNFEKIIESDYSDYFYETLPETHKKIDGYRNVLAKIKEGIKRGFISPQFHGREHLNIAVFKELIKRKDNEIICAINNRAYACITSRPFPNTSYASAFSFEQLEEVEQHKDIIKDGLKLFEEVYGYRSEHFTAPGYEWHRMLEKTLKEGGISFIDTDMFKKEHRGNGRFSRSFNYSGKRNKLDQYYIVRNCVYEPLLSLGLEWEDYCMMQIENAFKWHKPANISTHRVNFAGHIDPKNREEGLEGLRRLLRKIVQKWPDVEFMSTVELGHLITKSNN